MSEKSERNFFRIIGGTGRKNWKVYSSMYNPNEESWKSFTRLL